MKMRHYLAAAVVAVVGAGAAQAATITNGGFESDAVRGGFDTYAAGSGGLTGWTVGGAGVDLIGTLWTPDEGSNSLDLNAGNTGSISQTITDLVVGQKYEISFAMAGNADGGSVIKSLMASIGQNNGLSYSFDTTGTSRSDMGWEDKSFTFIADDTTALLTFASSTTSAYGPALDNISIAAVPLPASALFLLAGLSGLAVMRRKSA